MKRKPPTNRKRLWRVLLSTGVPKRVVREASVAMAVKGRYSSWNGKVPPKK